MQIIGQTSTLNNVDKVINIFTHSECEIKPHFILTGPSGSGKTLIIKYLAEKNNINFLEINAAQLTKEGTSGNSVSKAFAPLAHTGNKPTLVFVDEFDKLFISGNNNSDLAHESTNGVQNEFLKVLESGTTQVFGDYGKYITVSTHKLLFVFAGAFNGEDNITIDRLRDFGIKTEFLGRVGLVFNVQQLTLDNLFEILENSQLLDKYLMLFPEVDRETVVLKIKQFLSDNYDNNTLGARIINTLISQYFINGGKLSSESVKKISFQKTLSFD